MLTDSDSAYCSHLWRDTCTEFGIVPKRTRPYRPRTNGKVWEDCPRCCTPPSLTPATEMATVIGGVGTNKHINYGAVNDEHGRLLDHQEFAAADHGYQELLAWKRSHGRIVAIGVESTGSFGATLVLRKRTLVNRCLRLRPETDDLLDLAGGCHRLLTAGVKTSR
ncbi:hypothetical protein GCM10009610_63990 [Pseudonocardia xinjiangensis]